ncbi:FmdB family zinc ribbon protein [Glaciihabitans sp. dw_435]|uniref:FmdB family zinc ribbon protein n=1 Tax=Glaciihabitans sp. dw_435 TaxID=2720081 RepID=UPI001BD6DD1A|nr:FmdB family zinc ribbon protein [Glaciihabitans sp. dw_435]
MPTYSYKCVNGHAFDIHQEFTDDSLTVCPVCGGKLRKVFGAVGISFNGSGFYSTDSRSAGSKTSSGSSTSSSSSSSSSDSGSSSSSSDSKPATPAAPSTPAAKTPPAA